MLFKIQDSSDSNMVFLNPQHIVYIKERPNHGLWKIFLVGGEIIMTKNKKQIEILLVFLTQSNVQ